MMKFLDTPHKSKPSAITVDWVVLSAAIIGLVVAAYSSLQTGTSSLTADTSAYLEKQKPNG